MLILKLFKSFIHTYPGCAALPYDYKKQQYTSIVSNKQMDNLNDHQMKFSFQPWHHEQFYSLSGFVHLSSMYSFEELFSQAPLIKWFYTYQYLAEKCSS